MQSRQMGLMDRMRRVNMGSSLLQANANPLRTQGGFGIKPMTSGLSLLGIKTVLRIVRLFHLKRILSFSLALVGSASAGVFECTLSESAGKPLQSQGNLSALVLFAQFAGQEQATRLLLGLPTYSILPNLEASPIFTTRCQAV